mgnify:FL=1
MWIEIIRGIFSHKAIMSRPARALWIEIFLSFFIAGVLPVEAREGLVD